MANKPNNNRADRGKNRKQGNTQPSPEERRQALAKQLGIKPKTKEFVDNLLAYPNKSQAEVYMMNHKTESKRNAGIQASKLLKKASVIGYKDSAVKKAKNRIVTLIDSTNESIALKASESVIDRNEGRAVARSENTTVVTEVKLDIGGTRIGTHYIQAPDNDAQ